MLAKGEEAINIFDVENQTLEESLLKCFLINDKREFERFTELYYSISYKL